MPVIDNNGDLVEVGDFLTCLRDSILIKGRTGMKVRVAVIEPDGSDLKIGIVREDPAEGWHDLNRKCDNGCGYWLGTRNVRDYFRLGRRPPKNFVVKKDFVFRKKNLKGLKCRRLNSLDKNTSFMEFGKNIGGLSCDGLGKQGHCITINNDMVEAVDDKKEKKKK